MLFQPVIRGMQGETNDEMRAEAPWVWVCVNYRNLTDLDCMSFKWSGPSQSSPDEVSSVDPLYSAFLDNVPKMKVLLNKHLARHSAFIEVPKAW